MRNLFLKTGVSSLFIMALAIPVTSINKAYRPPTSVTVAVINAKGTRVPDITVYILNAANPCICIGGKCTLNIVGKPGVTGDKGTVDFSGLAPKTKYIAAIGAQCQPANCTANADCVFNRTAQEPFETNEKGIHKALITLRSQ